MKTIEIKEDKEYLTLGQLLKIEGYVYTGGETKEYLANNTVLVDGVAENRRGRKLYRGMTVVANGETFKLI